MRKTTGLDQCKGNQPHKERRRGFPEGPPNIEERKADAALITFCLLGAVACVCGALLLGVPA